MGKVNVTILDATGNKEQQATLPDDAPVRRIIARLVDMMQLPATDPGGQILSYKFQHKASGTQLADEQTLRAAGVRDDDVLRLLPEITAGR
ncbi:MAG TPA: EsaB/YukD family protein [Armatimonadota bacterium]|jgi:uncharacterized ubiquitin-like protein YukD